MILMKVKSAANKSKFHHNAIKYYSSEFFTDNYDHLMFEDGKQFLDMVYLKREKE